VSNRDAEAFEYYDDPSKREPAEGPPRRRRERALTQHVPVRFPASTVATVRELAEADGLSVSAWIRHAVEREVDRRAAPELSAQTQTDARAAIDRLRHDLAELTAALDRGESR
jgi:hypothetical protein